MVTSRISDYEAIHAPSENGVMTAAPNVVHADRKAKVFTDNSKRITTYAAAQPYTACAVFDYGYFGATEKTEGGGGGGRGGGGGGGGYKMTPSQAPKSGGI